jgi:hypothetical protein
MATGGLVPASAVDIQTCPAVRSRRGRGQITASRTAQAKELPRPPAGGEWAFAVSVLTFAAAPLPGLRLADPLARHVADHERRAGDQDSTTVSGCADRPAGGLPGTACPASVRDLAVPPGKASSGEADSSRPAGCVRAAYLARRATR